MVSYHITIGVIRMANHARIASPKCLRGNRPRILIQERYRVIGIFDLIIPIQRLRGVISKTSMGCKIIKHTDSQWHD